MDGGRENFSPQTDLRDFLAACEENGQLEKVDGAHWDKEMGAVVEVLYRERVEKAKAVLFDNIPGYPEGSAVYTACWRLPTGWRLPSEWIPN